MRMAKRKFIFVFAFILIFALFCLYHLNFYNIFKSSKGVLNNDDLLLKRLITDVEHDGNMNDIYWYFDKNKRMMLKYDNRHCVIDDNDNWKSDFDFTNNIYNYKIGTVDAWIYDIKDEIAYKLIDYHIEKYDTKEGYVVNYQYNENRNVLINIPTLDIHLEFKAENQVLDFFKFHTEKDINFSGQFNGKTNVDLSKFISCGLDDYTMNSINVKQVILGGAYNWIPYYLCSSFFMSNGELICSFSFESWDKE